MSQESFNLINSLQLVGGESKAISPIDPSLRVTLEFTKGYLYSYEGFISGKVNNNEFYMKGYNHPFMSHRSYENNGMWSKSYSTSTTRNNYGYTEYFVPCTIDVEGNGWLVETGLICQATGDYLIQKPSSLIDFKGKFTSSLPVTEGLKFFRLLKITPTTHEVVQHLFGEIPGRTIMRSYPGYNLNLNAKDQLTDLTEISLTLINLLQSTFKNSSNNVSSYYYKYEIDSTLQVIIEDNINKILTLIDRTSTSSRKGSIPRYLATYSNYSNTYLNDDSRLNRVEKIFEDDCFREFDPLVQVPDNCSTFAKLLNPLITSREVDNESVAWFLYLLIYYQELTQKDYSSYITELNAYLISQIDTRYNLPNQGWSSTPKLFDSRAITDKLLRVSTAYVAAFLKAHDLFNEPRYLEKAWLIWEAVINYFYNISSKRFYSSLTVKEDNEESLTYGLISAQIMGRLDIVENLNNYFKNKIKSKFALDSVEFEFKSNTRIKIDLEQLEINEKEVGLSGGLILDNAIYVNDDLIMINGEILYIGEGIAYRTIINPFINESKYLENKLNGFILNSAASPITSPVDATLPEDLRRLISNKYWVINRYTNYIVNSFEPNLVGNRYLNYLRSNYIMQSSYTESLELTDKKAFELIDVPFELVYSTRLDFWSMLDSAISTLPVDYGWFSSKALSRNSVVGNILYAIMIPAASTIRSVFSLFTSKDYLNSSFYLNNKLKDYNLPFLKFSSKDNKREFIKDKFKTIVGMTKEGMINLVNYYSDSKCRFYETYNKMLSTSSNSFYELENRIGEGYFHGGDIGYSIFEFEVYRPLTDLILNLIIDNKPAGAKILLQQNLQFNESEIFEEFNYASYSKADMYQILSTEDGECINYEDGACATLDEMPFGYLNGNYLYVDRDLVRLDESSVSISGEVI